MDMRWIRDLMVCLDGEYILMKGEYHLYSIIDYWK